ncbi:MAG: 4-hydroxythreonine-4-phosphate dehydrogenase PdxA [Deltaproteobacteria bacterium]|nr:4-hydroxythreonine-4-phosphate dehydrogenase PdxA [Deltaproteobacteria bacterium]
MKIGITPGDPRGIGAEIIEKALADESIRSLAEFVVYSNPPLPNPLPQGARESDVQAGHTVISYLDHAVADAMSGKIDAIVTAPITKKSLEAAGYPWPGHTEFLAEKSGGHKVVMMMAAPKLKVTLVTIHTPLKEVPLKITQEKISDTVRITFDSLKTYWGLDHPRVAVCGLNPHAGEQGLLGKEEIEIIAPTLERLRKEGYEVEGPCVPDAVFHDAYLGKYDAVVCMYHDQGLIPFKMLYFQEGVNVTLGLPIIRTSPDHGTAFDIAGKGIADASSMKAAIRLAVEMVEKRASKEA